MAIDQQVCLYRVGKGDCGEKAVDFIPISDRVAVGRIPVCAKHKAEHNRNAARLRVNK